MDILTRIVEQKRHEVARRKAERPLSALRDAPSSERRDFAAALRGPGGLRAITEIKRRSPSRGPLRLDVDPIEVAGAYAMNGAAAISVLTESQFFGGSDGDLAAVRKAVRVPVLRKDFTIDAYQVHESAAIGADAILLIVRVLSDAQIGEYLVLARELGLEALVEVHDEVELERAIAAGAQIIGVNNRNLQTFEVSLDASARLRPLIPRDCIAVAESGIHRREDVLRLEAAGFDSMLVGESLMTAKDPGRQLALLLGRDL